MKKPRVVIVVGEKRVNTAKTIHKVLGQYSKVGKIIKESPGILNLLRKNIFIIEIKAKKSNLRLLKNLAKLSSMPVLIATNMDADEIKWVRKLAKNMPASGFFVPNFDDDATREINNITNANVLNFGFQKGADFQATDVKVNGGLNFKLNYKGNVIPFWYEKVLKNEQIYSVLAGICVGVIFDLNFIEISKALKDYNC